MTLVLVCAGFFAGIAVRRRVVETQRATQAAGLVERLLDADTAQVPDIVTAMREYRQAVDPALRSELAKSDDDSRQKLHASLALLPTDPSQVDYLFKRLLSAKPDELPVLRDALKTHQSELTPKLWTVLESAKPSDASVTSIGQCAGKLRSRQCASGNQPAPRWHRRWSRSMPSSLDHGSKPCDLFGAISRLRCRQSFRKRTGPSPNTNWRPTFSVTTPADDPDRLAELLMVADPKAYVSLFPVAEQAGRAGLARFPVRACQEGHLLAGTIGRSIHRGQNRTPPS